VNKKINNITAFILAGGSSFRMGTNKALLKINGVLLIDRVLSILNKVFENIMISSNDFDSFYFTGKKIVKDIISNKGPLGGIHSCLQSTNTEKNFFISCDMPFISAEIVQFLCCYETDAEILLPKDGVNIQQMCGIYSKSINSEVEKLLFASDIKKNNAKGSIFELIEKANVEYVDVSKLQIFHKDLFFNMNTPEDFKYVADKFTR
jgi:molybdopterin-guanine dinucleotide biosynthesis protein A